MSFETRWATAQDVELYFGKAPEQSQRAKIGLLDGKVVALWALVLTKTGVGLISDIRPEMKHLKVTIQRTAKNFMKEVADLGYDEVYALADPDIPGSAKWIRSLGFRFAYKTDDGEVWLWQSRYHLS